jgi:hypothetical protein
VVYAVTVESEVYIGPPLADKLRDMSCEGCGLALVGNWAEYPEAYISEGKRFKYERDAQSPPDSDSLVLSFPGIYE